MANGDEPVDVSQADYIFAFRPEEDDFSRVRVLNLAEGGEEAEGEGGWELSNEYPYVGSHCMKWAPAPDRRGNAWLFSCGFRFEPNVEYVAGIYYAAGSPAKSRVEASAGLSVRATTSHAFTCGWVAHRSRTP